MILKVIKINNKWIIVTIALSICFIVLLFMCISDSKAQEEKENYIHWVEYSVPYKIMDKTAKIDIESQKEEVQIDWIELIAYLATKYGGDFKNYKEQDLNDVLKELKEGEIMENLVSNDKLYEYYLESYSAILGEFIGKYKIEKVGKNGKKTYEEEYGVKAFSPIAKNYSFSHYNDFGAARSYGYKRMHLGNDLMGAIGTPIIAVESGTIEAMGWNQYGGWRIGIRSFDKKRYYYYAHLRKDHPFVKSLKEGDIVTAGDVIGYLGMTGYSTKENVNNINIPHLHFGIQLIFNESQKEGTNQIWIDVYEIINFLKRNQSEVYRPNNGTKEFERKYKMEE